MTSLLSQPYAIHGQNMKSVSEEYDFDPSHIQQGRKLSRKLPPHLTESLEQLAISSELLTRTHQRTISDSEVSYPHQLTVNLPLFESGYVPAARRLSVPAQAAKKFSISAPRPFELEPSLSRSSGGSTDTPHSAPTAMSPGSFSTAPSLTHSRPSMSISTASIRTPPPCGDACGYSFDEPYRPLRKETRKDRKARKKAEQQAFNVEKPPSVRELFDASMLQVVDEDGVSVCFGNLVRGKRVIVVFIRHCEPLTGLLRLSDLTSRVLPALRSICELHHHPSHAGSSRGSRCGAHHHW